MDQSKRGKKRKVTHGKRVKKPRSLAFAISRRPEIKLVDASGGNVISAVATINVVNATIPGANETNRIGRKISLKSISFRGWVYWAQAGVAPAFDYLRIMLVYDRQPNGANPAIADILQGVDVAGTTTTTALSPQNISNADRFMMLRDHFWGIPAVNNGVGGSSGGFQFPDFKSTSFKDFIKLNGLETHYNAGTAGTIADITTGALFVVTIAQNAAANSQFATAWQTRVRYSDQ